VPAFPLNPCRNLGIIGEHAEWPVERLATSANGNMLASVVRLPAHQLSRDFLPAQGKPRSLIASHSLHCAVT
jgi:hypothetical protein